MINEATHLTLPRLPRTRSSLLVRLRQGLQGLRPTIPSDRDETLASLSFEQAAAFRELPSYDQVHLLRVHRTLRDLGERDADLLAAALLHDLGKISGSGRVRMIHRVARVVLGRVAPRLLARLGRLPAPRWRRGFALAVHHPRLGAERARALGCSERTCWLIEHHEDRDPPSDPALRRLIDIDHAV